MRCERDCTSCSTALLCAWRIRRWALESITASDSVPDAHLAALAIEHGLQSSNGTVIVHAVHQGRRLVLEVIDDGAGLPGDFELSTAASLGLSIVSTLVNDLGGEFTLRNNTGHGSTARVELELPANLPRL